MIDIDVIGIGCWSDCFANWHDLRRGLRKGEWASEASLTPEVIPARERRRAPHSVKMTVEVLDQATRMAGADRLDLAVVFSSAMGDMDITDAMCRTLASQPELVSPTRFHNSVHNAGIGYWSITTGAHAPASAIAGHDHSAALGLLEAATQCSENGAPVLLVCQEGAAPSTLAFIRDSKHALALALLLAPPGSGRAPLAVISLDIARETSPQPALPAALPVDFSGNTAAVLLPILAALASMEDQRESPGQRVRLPLNETCALDVEIKPVAGP